MIEVGIFEAKTHLSALLKKVSQGQEVLDHFNAAGRGWQTRMNEALREWVRNQDSA